MKDRKEYILQIVWLLEEIEDVWILEQILRCVKNMMKKE